VDRCRDRIDEAEAAKVFLVEPEPWPDPITDPPALFDAVLDRFVAYSYSPAGAPVVFSAFMGHTHAFPAFHYSPRINILSDKETCGKSTIVKVIASMAPRPFRVQNLRPPVVYRIIDKRQPVVLLDEIETYLPLYRELLGLLNAGNSSDALVPRCDGHHIRLYKAFAPVVLAGIGDLFRTLRSRSILIHMTEAPEGVTLTRFDSQHLELEKTLAQKLARWAADNLKAIAACDPPLPKGVRNRVADNWRPLFQIAHVVGAHWPALVTEAFHALTTAAPSALPGQNPSLKATVSDHSAIRSPQSEIDYQLLLSDIRQVFASAHADRLFSSDLVRALHSLPDRPWSGSHNGSKPITEMRLARLLSSLAIRPRTFRIGAHVARGYLLSDLPQPPSPLAETSAPDFEI
jgi:putative DNA primase/helicase